MIFTATTTATRVQTTPWKQQQQRPRFLTSRASVSFSSSSSSLLSKSSSSKGGGRQQPRGHRRRRSLPNEGAKTGRGVVVAGRFPDERTYIMIKCVVYVVVVFSLSSWLLLDFLTSSNLFSTKPRGFFYPLLLVKTSSFSPAGGGNETKTDLQNNNNSL